MTSFSQAEGTTPFTVQVECYSGYRGDETPRSFSLGSKTVVVAEIVDRWLGPDYRYFKVRGADGDLYILRHQEENGRWEMTFFSGCHPNGDPK